MTRSKATLATCVALLLSLGVGCRKKPEEPPKSPISKHTGKPVKPLATRPKAKHGNEYVPGGSAKTSSGRHVPQVKANVAPVEVDPGTARKISDLIRKLTQKDGPIDYQQAMAAEALGRIGSPAAPPLIRLLGHKSHFMRINAAVALREMGPQAQSALPALMAALKDDSWRVRYCAAGALGKIGPAAKRAVPQLMAIFQDKDAKLDTRSEAIIALGRIGPSAKPAVPYLTRALKSEYQSIRAPAATALGGIGAEARQAIPALSEILAQDDKATGRTGNETLRAIFRTTVTEALRRIRDDLAKAK